MNEISRYTNTKIVISDPEIRNIRVGGYFQAGETESLLTVLENNFDININRINDNLVYLTGSRTIQAKKQE